MRDADRATAILSQLRAMGIRLAVDDYGTGYSSLAYLHALPLDDLKLDRAFVAHCDTDPRSAAIVKSTVELAHNLGMRMIAEGVEDQDTLDALTHEGVGAVALGAAVPLQDDEARRVGRAAGHGEQGAEAWTV